MCSFVRNCLSVTVVPDSDCSIGCFHQQWMRVPVAPHPHQHLKMVQTLWSAFWTLAILIGVQWYLVILIRNSLMTYDIEHLFICLSVYLLSCGRCLFRSFAHLLIGGLWRKGTRWGQAAAQGSQLLIYQGILHVGFCFEELAMVHVWFKVFSPRNLI